MTAFIRSIHNFVKIEALKPIDYEMPIFSDDNATGQISFPGTLSTDYVGNWLEMGERLWIIKGIKPYDGVTTVTVADAFNAFYRNHIYPTTYSTVGEFLAVIFTQNYKQQTDTEYAMPYLDITNTDETPIIIPSLISEKLFNACDYLHTVSRRGVKIAMVPSGDLLYITIMTRGTEPLRLTFANGHNDLISQEYSNTSVSKVTAVINGANSYYYLQADGTISQTAPTPRIKGDWITIVTDAGRVQQDVAAAFAQNSESLKVEFYSDREIEHDCPVEMWLNSQWVRAIISSVSISGKDNRYHYKAGSLATTVTDKLRRTSSVAVSTASGGGIVQETDPTVPAWAKEPSKPSYTASEVGALPDTTVIPTELSQLSGDAGDISYSGQNVDNVGDALNALFAGSGQVDGALNYYATCNTAAGTRDKAVTAGSIYPVAGGFTLQIGSQIAVTFTNAQTYSGQSTLNVADTGAKPINAAGISGNYKWAAGEKLLFVYDGASWVILNAKPSVPAVNDGSLTFVKGAETLGVFTANDADNLTIAIPDMEAERFGVKFTETVIDYEPHYAPDKTLLETAFAVRSGKNVYGIIHRSTQDERLELFRYDLDTSDNLAYIEFLSALHTSEVSTDTYRTHITWTEQGVFAEIEWNGGEITVDSALSSTSENPVQNKVINAALGGKLDKEAQTAKTTAMTQAVGVDSDGKLWTDPGVRLVNGKTGNVTLEAQHIYTDRRSETETFVITGASSEANMNLLKNGTIVTAEQFKNSLLSGNTVVVNVVDRSGDLRGISPVKYYLNGDDVRLAFTANAGHYYSPALCILQGQGMSNFRESQPAAIPAGYQDLPTSEIPIYTVEQYLDDLLRRTEALEQGGGGGGTEYTAGDGISIVNNVISVDLDDYDGGAF